MHFLSRARVNSNNFRLRKSHLREFLPLQFKNSFFNIFIFCRCWKTIEIFDRFTCLRFYKDKSQICGINHKSSSAKFSIFDPLSQVFSSLIVTNPRPPPLKALRYLFYYSLAYLCLLTSLISLLIMCSYHSKQTDHK